MESLRDSIPAMSRKDFFSVLKDISYHSREEECINDIEMIVKV